VFALAVASCSNSVNVQPPDTEPEVASVCADLIDALPATVEEQTARDTEPASSLTAAWGASPIVLRCGVAEPTAFEPTSQLASVNGVDWFPEPRDDGYVFTTWGRTVRIEVTVPSEYAPEASPLVDLAPAIKATIPKI
jgi:Protein of unknown function (DUF3515)